MYASPEQRDRDIDEGAGRSGLDLQIDLDTSTGRLMDAFEELDEGGAWNNRVALRGAQVPTRMLPAARLTEVLLHHVDLDIGFEIADIENSAADWVLEWSALRLSRRDDFPRLILTSRTGLTVSVGNSGRPVMVTGESNELAGWLTSRTKGDNVAGSEGVSLPTFG